MGRGKAAKKATPGRQGTLGVSVHPHIKKPSHVIGMQIGVLGAYWQGRMSAEEKTTRYSCTVLEHSLAHKFTPGGTPEQAWEVQEMGQSGTGSCEQGDASGETFWMRNEDFLAGCRLAPWKAFLAGFFASDPHHGSFLQRSRP